ncbi:hypothetical protein PPSIR1_02793 [Plesiocystis pacifica SIR-1]|uniref:Uncharacterized protein n=2 Tax=Plesiocystis pacifica TaxID=191768 RepID=A6G929_9BACT|nr:hypothetical protein PPSIR1_02793 [Plesiocystis pacifica SIR-1]
MLPAILAGAGILLIGGLLFFGGDDDKKEAKQAKTDTKASASADTAKSKSGSGGVAARPTDDAKPSPKRTKPKLNPVVENAIVTNGMAPDPGKKKEPTSFDSVEDEIAYWEDRLVAANRNLEIRQMAVERTPKIEEKIRNGNDPVNGLKEFEKRKQVVKDNLEKAEAEVEAIELKLSGLKG